MASRSVLSSTPRGSAGQAANQLLALRCERPITHVKIYSRNRENRRKFAEKYGPMFNLDITPVDSPRDAVKGVDVIACATKLSRRAIEHSRILSRWTFRTLAA